MWALYSVLLIYGYGLVPVPYCFDHSSLTQQFLKPESHPGFLLSLLILSVKVFSTFCELND